MGPLLMHHMVLERFPGEWTIYQEGSGGQGMDAYSMDLRERVAGECDAGKLSQPKIAEKYQVSVSFITKLLRRRQETGSLRAISRRPVN